MSKSNKELAISVAIAAIEANPRTTFHANNSHIQNGLGTEDICNVIKSVHALLEGFDSKSDKE